MKSIGFTKPTQSELKNWVLLRCYKAAVEFCNGLYSDYIYSVKDTRRCDFWDTVHKSTKYELLESIDLITPE